MTDEQRELAGARRDRVEIEAALRRQGCLTEPLVQWLAGIDIMLAEARFRITELESEVRALRAVKEAGGE